MKTVSVKLPETLASWLSQRSKALGRTQSDLVREALEQQRTGAGEPSCHDLMEDFCGSFAGPVDLSTNPRHLEGFGQ
ncbi:MAG: CopG family transcriptional regulator [Verrucomicrobiae bacterium]|nr:CopG family transcriptional regulator [Verrucomicrobiae bacterium]